MDARDWLTSCLLLYCTSSTVLTRVKTCTVSELNRCDQKIHEAHFINKNEVTELCAQWFKAQRLHYFIRASKFLFYTFYYCIAKCVFVIDVIKYCKTNAPPWRIMQKKYVLYLCPIYHRLSGRGENFRDILSVVESINFHLQLWELETGAVFIVSKTSFHSPQLGKL